MADKQAINKDLKELENKLDYSFNDKDKKLLRRALTRKDAVQSNPEIHCFGHQETLATLGDAILRATLVDYLFEKEHCDTAAQITKRKIAMEKNETLKSISDKLDIEKFMRMFMSDNEKENTQMKMEKPLADTLEAIIGAIYLDADAKDSGVGYKTCREVILNWYEKYFPKVL